MDLWTASRFLGTEVLLLDGNGVIREASPAAARILAIEDDLVGRSLPELSNDPLGLQAYLVICGRSSQPVPGSARLGLGRSSRDYRLQGARVPPLDELSILVSLAPREHLDSRFRELNEKINAANQEISRRLVVEEHLRRSQARLEELLATRVREAEERRRLETGMLRAQKLESLGQLAGGVAHDFNNLLQAIVGNAEMADYRLGRDSPASHNLQEILKASRRAAELCSHMLAFSGRGHYRSEEVDLNQLVQDAADVLRTSTSHRATFEFDLPQIREIEVDPGQIRQVLLNLVINASDSLADASADGENSEGGTIRIETGMEACSASDMDPLLAADGFASGDYVYLRVVDDGGGIDPEKLERIFEPFFSTREMGRGLGLAAVLGIVRSHDGAVRVVSDEGRGTSVTVYLPPAEPVSKAEADDIVVSVGPPPTGSDPKRYTILVVDDEAQVRELVGAALKSAGFEVLTAVDGMDALEVYRAHRGEIDIVLLDLTMPRLDGAKTLQRLRQIDPGSNVILSSGYIESSISTEALGQSEAMFLQKPYSLSKLLEAFQTILGSRETENRPVA